MVGPEQCATAAALAAKDDFDVLQLPLNAHAAAVVRTQYRKLALLLHPDKNSHPQAEAAFHRLVAAFEVLSDPQQQRAARSAALRNKQQAGIISKSSAPVRQDRTARTVSEDEFARLDAMIKQQAAESALAAKLQKEARKATNDAREANERRALRGSLLDDSRDWESNASSWRNFSSGSTKSTAKVHCIDYCLLVTPSMQGR
jgi:DnaJ-class molecular chaperone